MTDATRPVRPSGTEIQRLLEIAERDLAQAQLPSLHLDTRFALAYNAGLQLATAVLRLHGIRVRSAAFHRQTFVELRTQLPVDKQNLADFLDRARRKRNTAAYEQVNVVSEAEVNDLISQIQAFNTWVAEEVTKPR